MARDRRRHLHDADGLADALILRPGQPIQLVRGLAGGELDDVSTATGLATRIAGLSAAWADFDGDGMNDVLFRNLSTNKWSVAFMNGRTPISLSSLDIESSADWEFNAANDFDGDGKADISLRNRTTEKVSVYLLNGLTIASQGEVENSLRNCIMIKKSSQK